MRVVLFLLAIVVVLFALVVLSAASGALHEIEAFILFLIAAVLLIGAAIVDALLQIRKDLLRKDLQTSGARVVNTGSTPRGAAAEPERPSRPAGMSDEEWMSMRPSSVSMEDWRRLKM